MPLVPLLALVIKKSKYRIKPITTKNLCKKSGKRKHLPQVMETSRKHLCKYTNKWFQIHQEPGRYLGKAHEPKPKARRYWTSQILTFYYLRSRSHPEVRTLKQENEVICSPHFSPSLAGALLPQNQPCLSHLFEPPLLAPWNSTCLTRPSPTSPPHLFHRTSAGLITSCSEFLQNLSLEIILSSLTYIPLSSQLFCV